MTRIGPASGKAAALDVEGIVRVRESIGFSDGVRTNDRRRRKSWTNEPISRLACEARPNGFDVKHVAPRAEQHRIA
jgi:hypothetical protein